MKRTVIITLILSFFLSVNHAQTINKVVKDENNKDMLLGKIDKNGLQKAPFSVWFNKNQDDYIVNTKLVKTFSKDLKNYTIKAFFGTWCGDSKSDVPKFYKVLEEANFPMNQLETIALDHSDAAYKQGPNGEEKGQNIHRVPTFVFYKDGKEVNRIVEEPAETLERDILKIVKEKRYRPKYTAANYLGNLLNTKPLDSLKKETNNLRDVLSNYVKHTGELNTLGYVFLRANEVEKALITFKVNTAIFPYRSNVYDSLAEAYFITKNYTEALKNYYKVLSIKPDDENALKMVEKINKLKNVK